LSPCDKCPRRLRHTEFERATERLWETNLSGADRKGIGFREMEEQIHRTIVASQLPESKRPATTGAFITAYEAERARFKEYIRRTGVSG